MTDATKSYGVRFYSGASATSLDEEPKKVSVVLSDLVTAVAAGRLAPQFVDAGECYELRDLISFNGGAVIRGVLAVLRNDAPHIREAAGAERPIELAEGESILEKNHFIFYRQHELLVWQVNGRASHVVRLERYLSHCAGAGTTVTFDDVLSLTALQQLSQGVVTRLEFRVASPRNAAAIQPDNWEDAAFEMMRDSNATTITVMVNTRRKNAGLSDILKGTVHRLLDAETTRKVAIKLRGIEDPIDMMTECLKGRITVTMDGLYPLAGQVFAEIDAVKASKQANLDAFFGQGNATLE